jgi:hypothetical protein
LSAAHPRLLVARWVRRMWGRVYRHGHCGAVWPGGFHGRVGRCGWGAGAGGVADVADALGRRNGATGEELYGEAADTAQAVVAAIVAQTYATGRVASSGWSNSNGWSVAVSVVWERSGQF